MSASDPDSKIDILDSADDVKQKLKKAFCEPGKVEGNGILAFARYVLFPILSGEEFIIERAEKFGGTIKFTSYEELEEAYAKEVVYPLDLKDGVATHLNSLMESIRRAYAASPEFQKTRNLAYPPPANGAGQGVDISRLDIRVGHVVSAEKHPEADSLYIEKIDVGEEEPRTVVSGLAEFMTLEDLRNRDVVVLCNLKPAKLKGVLSQAMLLAASSDGVVEPLDPPPESNPGDRVFVAGYEQDPAKGPIEQINPKKKIFEQIQPDLVTSDVLVATYKGLPLQTAQGTVGVKSLKSASIR